eukprot:243330-Rhodomonas_salina.2
MLTHPLSSCEASLVWGACVSGWVRLRSEEPSRSTLLGSARTVTCQCLSRASITCPSRVLRSRRSRESEIGT